MSVRVRDLLMRELDVLRYEPIDKRIRATLGDDTVIDSTRAMLVWEPKRVVPTYAVPSEDVDGEILSVPRSETGDFDAFDAWYEEDERNVGHPRDPFHRIDIVHSSRHVRLERDGVVLAESTRPYLLFEPPLPVRYYLPPEDVRSELLRPSETRSFCASP